MILQRLQKVVVRSGELFHRLLHTGLRQTQTGDHFGQLYLIFGRMEAAVERQAFDDVSDNSPCRTDAFVRSSEIRHDIDERTKASVLRFRSIATFVGNVFDAIVEAFLNRLCFCDSDF